MHILILEKISDSSIDWLRQQGAQPILGFNGEDWKPLVNEIEALIIRGETYVTPDLLDKLPALRVVGKSGVGTERIDLDATAARNIKVTNTPGANAASVAELAITLLSAAARDIVSNDGMVRQGRFKERHGNRYKQELTGTRLGVIGAGRIGKRVAEIARGGFSCEIGFYDPYVVRSVVEYLSPVILATAAELFEWADHVVVAAPLTSETKLIVGLNELTLLGPNGIIVVSSRGGIIDEAALAHALDEGLIHGAGLDVFDPEPPSNDNPLLTHPKVVLSPHMGGHTAKTRDRMFTEVCQQTWSLLNGREAVLVGLEPWRPQPTS